MLRTPVSGSRKDHDMGMQQDQVNKDDEIDKGGSKNRDHESGQNGVMHVEKGQGPGQKPLGKVCGCICQLNPKCQECDCACICSSFKRFQQSSFSQNQHNLLRQQINAEGVAGTSPYLVGRGRGRGRASPFLDKNHVENENKSGHFTSTQPNFTDLSEDATKKVVTAASAAIVTTKSKQPFAVPHNHQ